MKMIVGLGNPGGKYKSSRHNIGFLVIDELTRLFVTKLDKRKHQGEYTIVSYNKDKVLLLKPQTFMNLSGESVAPLMKYYDIAIEDLVVIYDDLDLPCGKLRLRPSGGSAGHNGLKSIIKHLGSSEFKRVRVGIEKDPLVLAADYVLGKPNLQQKKLIKKAIIEAALAIREYLDSGFDQAMNSYNKNEKSSTASK